MRISNRSSDVCSSDLLPFLAAAPAAALPFAVAHQVWVLVPVLAFMGLVLAAVTERSGSLWPAIILHGVFNSAMPITYYTALAAGADVDAHRPSSGRPKKRAARRAGKRHGRANGSRHGP